MSDLISKKSKEDMLKEISELRSEITELKAANFELKSGYHKNTQKHKKNRNLFHSIFEDAGVGMAIINRNTEIVKFNRAFQDLFGYSTDELYRLSYFDMIPEQKKANAVKFIEALFAAKLDKFEGEEIYLKKDKSPIWLRLTTTVINDEFGIPEYIIGMGEDITDKIEYEEKLKEAKNKAEESDKLKTAFLANMSHEIRTPMNAIIGFAELMADPNLDIELRKEFVDQIYSSSKTLTKLIDDIIDISQIDTGDLKTSERKFNVSKIINDLHKTIYNNNEITKNLEILTHNPFGELPAFIKTDEYRFKQIFEHLLNNALKYTEQGFIEFGFDIDHDEFPTFYVRDTGIGIPEDKKDFIFKHFTKLEDRAKLYRGTGIGLTITQKLVKLLGGNIWVESHPGIGSIFYFTIPSKIVLFETPVENQRSIKNYNWDGKNILIAEDEDTNYEVIKASLNRTYATLTRVTQGDQAIELCRANHYDIILMDVKMPVMNGVDATKIIKKFKPNIPIIAQTAYVFKNERDMCIDAGCDEYIPKPIKSKSLLEMISKLID